MIDRQTNEMTIAFVKVLVEDSPALAQVFAEHSEDNGGNLLPHVFFADVARALSASGFPKDERSSILNALDENLAPGDDPISNLISVSFVEHLSPTKPLEAAVVECFGPNLSAARKRIWNLD